MSLLLIYNYARYGAWVDNITCSFIGEIYTGLIDGRIVKLNNNEVVNVTRFREGMTLQCSMALYTSTSSHNQYTIFLHATSTLE